MTRRRGPRPAAAGARRPAPTAPAPAPPPALRGTARWLLPALWILTLAAYQPAWHGGPVWDDDDHLTRAELRSSDGLGRIWFEMGATPQYYPLTHSAFWLQARLWGDDTLGYHLVNITLHALSAGLFFLVLRRLSVPGAALGAALFALHPVHVESVAWITELKNVLSGVFYLGAALLYLRFDDTRRRAHRAGAFGLFVLALLCKTVTATLPAALLVVAWWRRGRIDLARDVRPLAPFFAAGLAFGLLTVWVERTYIGAVGADFALTPIERVLVAGRAIWFYLGKLAWPWPLVFVYERWEVSQAAWWQYLHPAGVAALAVLLWRARQRSRAPLAALALFAAGLFPALGFFNVFPFRFSYVADHFQYLASLPVLALAAAGFARLAPRAGVRTPAGRLAASAALVAPLAVLTFVQSGKYASAETLYRETLARNPAAWMAHHNLAVHELRGPAPDVEAVVARIRESLRLYPRNAEAHNTLGVALQRLGRHDEALAAHQEAVRLEPRFADAFNNLGTDLLALGRVDEAVAAHREAVRLRPSLAEAHQNLGIALQEAGRVDEAVTHILEALRLRPDYAAAHDNLGSARYRQARLDEAIGSYRRAAALDPAEVSYRSNLGYALAALGRHAEAEALYREALGRPAGAASRARVLSNLGEVLVRTGRAAEAEPHLRESLRLRPGAPAAHYALGSALFELGRVGEAVAEYEAALAREPGPAAARVHNDLGVALATLGRLPQAVVHFREALRLRPDFAEARANLARAGGR